MFKCFPRQIVLTVFVHLIDVSDKSSMTWYFLAEKKGAEIISKNESLHVYMYTYITTNI